VKTTNHTIKDDYKLINRFIDSFKILKWRETDGEIQKLFK